MEDIRTTENILVTGLKYSCRDKEELQTIGQHLRKDTPQLLLVMLTTHDYGIVVNVLEGTQKLGVVSRFDIRKAVSLISSTGYTMLTGKVSHVSKDNTFITVDIENVMDDCKESTHEENIDIWETWMPSIAIERKETERESQIETCISVLEYALSKPGIMHSELIKEFISNLIESSKYDVSAETQESLNNLRVLISNYPDSGISAMLDTFVKALNDLGSKERIADFKKTFIKELLCSVESDNLFKSCDYTEQEIDSCLMTLPYDLFHYCDNIGILMHQLIYRNIPKRKLNLLLSLLLLRERNKSHDSEFTPPTPLPYMVKAEISTNATSNLALREAIDRVIPVTGTRGSKWKWSHVKRVMEDNGIICSGINSCEFGRQMHEINASIDPERCRKNINNYELKLSCNERLTPYWEWSDNNINKKTLMQIGELFTKIIS